MARDPALACGARYRYRFHDGDGLAAEMRNGNGPVAAPRVLITSSAAKKLRFSPVNNDVWNAMDSRHASFDEFPCLTSFAGGHEMAALIGNTDWSGTPLGAVRNWPQSLHAAVGICVNACFPMVIWWGPEHVMLYNDAYRCILGARHPDALGRSGAECWPEDWGILGPTLDSVLNSGNATWSDDHPLLLERDGRLEERYFTLTYAPIRDDSGGTGGVFTTLQETTRRVLGTRWHATLRALEVRSDTLADALKAVTVALEADLMDIPLARIYLAAGSGNRTTLVAAIGRQRAAAEENEWPVQQVLEQGRSQLVGEGCVPAQRGGPYLIWPPPPEGALVAPLLCAGGHRALGVVVFGLSSRRALDAEYRGFLDQVVACIAAALHHAWVQEEELNRAWALSELERVKAAIEGSPTTEFRASLTLLLASVATLLNSPSASRAADAPLKAASLLRGQWEYIRAVLDSVLAKVTDAVLVLTHDGCLRYANDQAVQYLGSPTDAFAERSLWDHAGLLAANLRRFCHQALAQGQVVSGDCRGPDDRWCEVRVYPGSDGFTVLLVDITDRKRVERALSEAAARERAHAAELDALMEAVPTIVWVSHDPECRRISGNAAGCALLRMPRSANLSMTAPKGERPTHFRVRQHGRELPGNELPLQRATRGEVIRDHEEEVVFEDGSSRRLLGNAVPLRDAGGNVRGAVAAFVDVTEQMRIQEALRESEQRYRCLVELSPDALFVYMQRRILYANRKCQYIFGVEDMQQLLGRDPLDWLPAESSAAVAERLVEVEQGANIAHLLGHSWTRCDGSTLEVDLSAAPVPWEQGRAVQVLVRDTTERAALEDRLRRQAQQLAEADRRKNEFLATLAHELRNPLAPIRNVAELLKRRGLQLDPALQGGAEVVGRQVDQLVRLVDDLLDLARIASGRIELRLRPVSIEEVLTRALDTVTPSLDPRNHELTVRHWPTPVQVMADPNRLAQVFSNLLDNAIKYTEEGGSIWLDVRCDADLVVITVRDDGIGIAPDVLPRVFDAFLRGDTGLEHSRGGLGLGLALARSLVLLHGGSIGAFSAGVGLGAEFVVHLPLAAGETLPESRPAGSHATARRQWRVLVVDDNHDVAESFAQLLIALGHDVRAAYDGPNALAMAEEFAPQCVFLDIGMPKMDGYEVARRLREQTGDRPMMLVALTGYGSVEGRARDALFDRYLLKPVDIATVEEVLDAAPGQKD